MVSEPRDGDSSDSFGDQVRKAAAPETAIATRASIGEECVALREEREAFEAEKLAAEKILADRRRALDQQRMILVEQLRDLHEKEQELAHKLSGGASPDGDVETLQSQLRELQYKVELLQAERDALATEMQTLCEQQLFALEKLQADRDEALARAEQSDKFEIERDEALLKLEEVKTVQRAQEKLIGQLRLKAYDSFATRSEEIDLGGRNLHADGLLNTNLSAQDFQEQLDRLLIERERVLEENQHLKEYAYQVEMEKEEVLRNQAAPQNAPAPLAIVGVDQAEGAAELETQRTRMVNDRRLLDLRQADFDAECERTHERFAEESQRFERLEDGLAEARRLLEEERRQVEFRDAQVRARESELDLTQKREPAQRVSAASAETRTEIDPSALESRFAELCEREKEMTLREAELREMREIIDQDSARVREDTVQERLRIARMRESLRIEEEALEAKRAAQNVHA